MSLDLAESMLARGKVDPDDLAIRFARSYRWSRGYGPATAKMLKRIARGADWRIANRSVYPNGSFGNGAAMRAPVVGLFYANRLDELVDAARLSAAVTHAHALGIEGAVLVACATALAVRDHRSLEILDELAARSTQQPFISCLAVAKAWLESGNAPSADEVARQLGNAIAASDSSVTAVYLALRFRDRAFEELQQFVVACGGDVDTIGAMAGAIWGAANGAEKLPSEWLVTLEQREKIASLASALYEKSPNHDISGSDSLQLDPQR
jgi:poly(ADP-ribose) glycohydrolase ARH3